MNPLSHFPVFFGTLSGKDHPFYGEKKFSVATGTFGEAPDVHYSYEHYRLISYSGLITREQRSAWIPADMDENEAVAEIRKIQYEIDTRDRFGVRF
jgi:hypothetical protein